MKQAKFVVAVRDPRDQILSELEVRIRGEDGALDPSGVQFKQVPGLIRKFQSYWEPLLAATRLAPERFMFVRYEDMLARYDETLAALQGFTGLSDSTFNPAGAWTRYAATDDFIPNYPSYSPFYGGPLEPARAGRFRTVLRPQDLELIEGECRSFMDMFGYEAAHSSPARSAAGGAGALPGERPSRI
ncbi:sulfotransferase [Aestuariivirga sp.]|uniref:sulfotransferase n=1 Tax=Aestuariivirga sp. TaxID=2650926 RepID=UPI00359481B9